MTDAREALVALLWEKFGAGPNGPLAAWLTEADCARFADAILGAGWTPPGERVTDPRDVAHIECDCVPDLGPSHCHLCSTRAGAEVPWAEAHPAPAPLPSVEDVARALADDWNPDRDPILTAMFRDYAQTVLALLPGRTEREVAERAWDKAIDYAGVHFNGSARASLKADNPYRKKETTDE